MYIVLIVVSQIDFQRLGENFQDIDAECFWFLPKLSVQE